MPAPPASGPATSRPPTVESGRWRVTSLSNGTFTVASIEDDVGEPLPVRNATDLVDLANVLAITMDVLNDLPGGDIVMRVEFLDEWEGAPLFVTYGTPPGRGETVALPDQALEYRVAQVRRKYQATGPTIASVLVESTGRRL